tara:strand:- start:604 stop:786 length:183 start_codon:yes stop_codon:yes gene_type:complete
MKIYITKFIHDGKEYDGPNIHAHSADDAELIAESQGLEVLGELEDLIQYGDLEDNEKVLH